MCYRPRNDNRLSMKKHLNLVILIIVALLVAAVLAVVYCQMIKENKNFDWKSFAFISKNTSVDTADWLTYRNEKYGFEIKLPTELGKNIPTDLQGENTFNDSPWYMNKNYLLFRWNFNGSQKEQFIDFSIQNTIDEKRIASSGGWENCDKIKEEKIGINNVKIFSIDKGVLKMFVISYDNKSFVFIPYHLDETLFMAVLSTFKFIK
jgi:hypothetical protein